MSSDVGIYCERRAERFFKVRLPKMYEEQGDLMQDYRIKVWKHRDTIASHPYPDSCLQEIASSVWKDYLRDRARHKRSREVRQCELSHTTDTSFDVDAYTNLALSIPAQPQSGDENVSEIADQFLSEDQSTIIKMRYVDEVEYDDIAVAMGVDRSTVYWKHQRAIQALRKKCSKEMILTGC